MRSQRWQRQSDRGGAHAQTLYNRQRDTGYDIGKMFIRYSYDLIVDMKEFEQISTIGEL